MITTTGRFEPKGSDAMNTKRHSKAGFTLVEIMVTVTISAFILTSVYATIISLAKGSESMMNYTEMNTQTRIALEVFGRDARMANYVHEFGQNRFTMKREIWDRSTNAYVEQFITYEVVPSAGTFSRTVYGVNIVNSAPVPGTVLSSETLLFDVAEMNFYYYRLVDLEDPNYSPIATSIPEVKHVQLEAKLERSVLNLVNTNYILSARFMMRNKDVSE